MCVFLEYADTGEQAFSVRIGQQRPNGRLKACLEPAVSAFGKKGGCVVVCGNVGLLFEIQSVEGGNGVGVSVYAAFSVLSRDKGGNACQPCFEALLILPHMGQFVYQPHSVFEGFAGKIFRTVAGEVDVAVWGNRCPDIGDESDSTIYFDFSVVDSVAENKLRHFDFAGRQSSP